MPVLAAEFQKHIRQAALDPLKSRRVLHSALLNSATYLLHVGDRPLSRGETRVLRGKQSFSLWADVDPEFDGVWVPVFTQRKHVSAYIAQKRLKAPAGREFQWMRHEPGKVYPILQGIQRFAGVLLDPVDNCGGARLDWPEVNALSEGRMPPEAPVLYELPVADYRLPEGTEHVFSKLGSSLNGVPGRQVLLSAVEVSDLQDYRRLVRLRFEKGEEGWTPCRHFIAALRDLLRRGVGDEAPQLDILVKSLIEFEMYGEAEGYCARLAAEDDRQSYALAMLAVLYRRAGRLDKCIEACRTGIKSFPKEKAFYVNQALAHAQMEDMGAARDVARAGLRAFPNEADLQRFL